MSVEEPDSAQQSQSETPQMGGRQFEAATPLEGEIVEAEQPREGTLAWLVEQPHIEVLGRRLPACHRLDVESGSLLDQADDGKCQYMRPTGQRCGAPRLPSYGICLIHAGGGNPDVRAMGKLGAAAQARLKVTRQTLGISASRAADPRQQARLAAQNRAQEIADGLLAPLDDPDLSSVARQRSAVTILDSLWPQEQTTVTVEMPSDEAGVQSLSWAQMQHLAAQLLGDNEVTEQLDPA